jgi:uncharacterized glyoxalase superfamily protein PhnB
MTDVLTHSHITPGLAYGDAQAAIRWLTEVLGFRTSVIYEDGPRVHFAQLSWAGGAIHVSTRDDAPRLPVTGPASIALTAADAASVDALYERAISAGAEILLPLEDTFYGNHGFSLRDPEGHQWHIGTPWLESDAARSMPRRTA